MTMRMLIDARHREETRVAVVKGNRIEEFDFESSEHKQLKGNIYLAKVTRVEPSLQAAFIDYGGNRHGFLAFSEIHPDYYQIPKEDREALLREEAEHAAEEEALRAAAEEEFHGPGFDAEGNVEEVSRDTGDRDDAGESDNDDDREDEYGDERDAPADESARDEQGERDEGDARLPRRGKASDRAVDALREKRMNLRRRYKIQDVIRRRQVLLVQVVKEERGNKGAALTTYLSLAGRYCVLMPNTSHGGGISRKISNAGDRKRLKSIMAELKLPPTMGCIVRTAGLQRTRVEIKRDFDYLARLWDEIRDTTLQSAAPALIYGDSDLLKRAIRDIYNRDIEEVIVEGPDGYRQAKEFMRLLMPSHARRVKPYADVVPLFQRSNVEDQLAAMYSPTVQLKSGGYLVINPTEALVSIDINSGRSTREHGIEATAVNTNLEAAHEIARQLRLRDMAGLVVIDFIDMENNSNIRKVEKAMKGALANDRARIQVGRISSFGLMEMSRQRLRTGVLEASTRGCPHCEGTGLVRTASSAGLSALRMLEDEAGQGRGSLLTLRASQEATVYVLNRKRAELAEIEDRYGVTIEVLPDGEAEGARMGVEVSGPPPAYAPKIPVMPIEEFDDDDLPLEDEDEDEAFDEEDEEQAPREARAPRADQAEGDAERGERSRKRRRRRGRRNRRDEEGGEAPRETGDHAEGEDEAEAELVESEAGEPAEVAADGEEKPKRPRRGRRGGRRRREEGAAEAGDQSEAVEQALQPIEAQPEPELELPPVEAEAEVEAEAAAPVAEDEAKPKRARRRPKAEAKDAEAKAPVEKPAPKPRTRKKKAALSEADGVEPVEDAAEVVGEQPVEAVPAALDEPAPGSSPGQAEVAPQPVAAPEPDLPLPEPANDQPAEPARRGWWQRTFGGTE